MASSSDSQTGQLIRRLLFFIILLSISLLNLVGSFKGLSTPRGMEQAQIARETARGNFLGSKMIRPRGMAMMERQNEDVGFKSYKDTYHAPLHPIVLSAVLKMVGGDDFERWQMEDGERIYSLDRVIACSAVIFFLLAILVNYMLITKIFDSKIGGVTALLLLLCNLYWQYSSTGLPQMLMLLLFSLGLLFAYSAVEANKNDTNSMVPAIFAGVCFTLLALTHWLAIWILAAYIIYVAVAFQPRGVIGLTLGFITFIACFYFVNRNLQLTGHIFGNAYYVLYNGLSNSSEDIIMRSYDLSDGSLELDTLVLRIASTLLTQLTDLYKFLGAILAAPLFFLALLHPFKRESIASFRWLVLGLWVAAAAGMAIYGLNDSTSSNQLHLLFTPIFTAYGLAFISILWMKLDLVDKNPFLSNIHFIVVVCISAGPLVLSLPKQIKNATSIGLVGIPHWPPYWPAAMNLKLHNLPEDQIIMTDQPWSTAWYADRMAVWMPQKLDQFNKLDEKATLKKTPVAGFFVTPESNRMRSLNQALVDYGEFSSMVMDGPVAETLHPRPISLYELDPKLSPISKRFTMRSNVFYGYMYFYGTEPLDPVR